MYPSLLQLNDQQIWTSKQKMKNSLMVAKKMQKKKD
jgi:hypothetical protein